MFSKAGRHTSEKYMVFQKKDEIIGGKRKLLKLGSAPSIEVIKLLFHCSNQNLRFK